MIEALFGHGRDLDSLQIAVRAFVMFFVALALVRLGGMRTFGRKSSLDSVIVIVLGTVLARPIVGISPAVPCMIASLVLVVVHRALAAATTNWPALDRLLKGRPATLYQSGKLDEKAMRRAGISHGDLVEAVHRHARTFDLGDVHAVLVEASGELSVIDRPR
jgi:uncharacterized membrane protein YcaP (DUF421 family)